VLYTDCSVVYTWCPVLLTDISALNTFRPALCPDISELAAWRPLAARASSLPPSNIRMLGGFSSLVADSLDGPSSTLFCWKIAVKVAAGAATDGAGADRRNRVVAVAIRLVERAGYRYVIVGVRVSGQAGVAAELERVLGRGTGRIVGDDLDIAARYCLRPGQQVNDVVITGRNGVRAATAADEIQDILRPASGGPRGRRGAGDATIDRDGGSRIQLPRVIRQQNRIGDDLRHEHMVATTGLDGGLTATRAR